jgi:3-hydroxyacyl-CoA dehydrogenase
MGSAIAQIAAQGGFDVIAAQLRLLDAAFRGSRHRASFSPGEPVTS